MMQAYNLSSRQDIGTKYLNIIPLENGCIMLLHMIMDLMSLHILCQAGLHHRWWCSQENTRTTKGAAKMLVCMWRHMTLHPISKWDIFYTINDKYKEKKMLVINVGFTLVLTHITNTAAHYFRAALPSEATSHSSCECMGKRDLADICDFKLGPKQAVDALKSITILMLVQWTCLQGFCI